ncbi:MAG TPA: potassium channel family protein [Candidatus Competibacteraceae bacterium]|nr:potassium channel family protein [Candidatus Competibacteraceae bacterium]
MILSPIAQGILLIGLTVLIHAGGLRLLLWRLAKHQLFWEAYHSLLVDTLWLTGVVSSLVVLHLTEIVLWALFFYRKGLFPNLETAGYYSLLTYTTVGYGDVVLPQWWRLVGTSEALVGILMTAWSTALLVGVVTRLTKRLMDKFDQAHSERQGLE